MLIALRHAGEVLLPQELPELTGRPPDPREVKMAGQLIATLEDDFRPADFHDDYRERDANDRSQSAGRKAKLARMPRREPTTALLDRLAASLNQARRRERRGRCLNKGKIRAWRSARSGPALSRSGW